MYIFFFVLPIRKKIYICTVPMNTWSLHHNVPGSHFSKNVYINSKLESAIPHSRVTLKYVTHHNTNTIQDDLTLYTPEQAIQTEVYPFSSNTSRSIKKILEFWVIIPPFTCGITTDPPSARCSGRLVSTGVLTGWGNVRGSRHALYMSTLGLVLHASTVPRITATTTTK